MYKKKTKHFTDYEFSQHEKKTPKHSDKIGKVTCCIRKCIIAMWANILVFQGCPHKILVANGEWATVNFKPSSQEFLDYNEKIIYLLVQYIQ